jgi:hypothetical protein
MGADETKIEASFCAAIRIAKEQKSVSLEKHARATYAEYARQKASGSYYDSLFGNCLFRDLQSKGAPVYWLPNSSGLTLTFRGTDRQTFGRVPTWS